MEIYIWIIIALLAVNVIVSIYAISEPTYHKVFVREELIKIHGSLSVTVQQLNTINERLRERIQLGFPVNLREKSFNELMFIKNKINSFEYDYVLGEIKNELTYIRREIENLNA
tara:strand:+ start:271 stop:612 length:342 start_codon:yes stop_codon:yes gene_type:complete